MPDDTTNKLDQTEKGPEAAAKVEELPKEPVTELDAQAIKGGTSNGGARKK